MCRIGQESLKFVFGCIRVHLYSQFYCHVKLWPKLYYFDIFPFISLNNLEIFSFIFHSLYHIAIFFVISNNISLFFYMVKKIQIKGWYLHISLVRDSPVVRPKTLIEWKCVISTSVEVHHEQHVHDSPSEADKMWWSQHRVKPREELHKRVYLQINLHII